MNTYKLKQYLKRQLKPLVKELEIGDEYSYQGNKVAIIPIQFNSWWYGTIQIQGNHMKAKISKIAKNSHVSPFVSELSTMNSDNAKMLTDMLKSFIQDNQIR